MSQSPSAFRRSASFINTSNQTMFKKFPTVLHDLLINHLPIIHPAEWSTFLQSIKVMLHSYWDGAMKHDILSGKGSISIKGRHTKDTEIYQMTNLNILLFYSKLLSHFKVFLLKLQIFQLSSTAYQFTDIPEYN